MTSHRAVCCCLWARMVWDISHRGRKGCRRCESEWKWTLLRLQEFSAEVWQLWQNHLLLSRGSSERRIWNMLLLIQATYSVSQWPIYYFHPVQQYGRVHQGSAFSALNNLSWAATCEIIELTRIYSSRWSFFFLLGLWVMTIRVTTWVWCKMYMLILSHFSFSYYFMTQFSSSILQLS